MSTVPTPPTRDAGSWAKHAGPLRVLEAPAGARNRNVDGRELAGPMQGFGKMWQKTYRVTIAGVDISPAEVIAAWKANYDTFWPAGNRFHAPLAGIKPGEIGLIDADMPGKVTLSTGVMVLYVDDLSFSFMTPQGHPFAGWITFSAEEGPDGPVAQVDLLIRAQDPLTEVGMMLGGHRSEDTMWQQTLTNLAAHFGVTGEVDTLVRCVDKKRQWRRAGNVRHDAALLEAAHLAGGPARASGASWARLVMSAGIAMAVVQVLYQGIVGAVIPPLLIFAVLGLICGVVVQRRRRFGGGMAAVVAVLFAVGSGPFIGPAVAHPESPVDFVHAVWSLIAAVGLFAGGVALLRGRVGRPVRLAGGTAVAAGAALVLSIGAAMAVGDDSVLDADQTAQAVNFAWSPESIVVPSGGVLALDNQDPARHTFTVEGTDIDVEMPAGRTRTQVIDLPAGTYPYICAVPGHETMTGQMTVQ